MEILYLSSSLVPSETANSIQVMKMCEAFAENGNNVTLFARRGREGVHPFDYYGIGRKFTIEFSFSPKVKGEVYFYILALFFKFLFKRFNGDLLYGRNPLGLLFCSFKKIDIIFESHAPPQGIFQKNIQKKLFKKRNFKSLVVISNSLKNYYIKKFPELNENRILIAHDGADKININNTKKSLEGNFDFNLGYVGHLHPGKGVEIVIELAKRMPEIGFHVVGGKSHLIKKFKEVNLQNLFFYGHKPFYETKAFMKSFDVLLAPYKKKVKTYHGKIDIGKWMSPLKIFEYMAVGKPIISSDLPVLKEVLVNKKNCLLCDPDVISEWIRAVNLLKNDKELRIRIAENARREFNLKYTWKQRAEKILKNINLDVKNSS